MPEFRRFKNTDDNLALVSRLMKTLGPDFCLFAGLESTAFAMLALGGCGTMITTSNVAPRQIARLNEKLADLAATRMVAARSDEHGAGGLAQLRSDRQFWPQPLRGLATSAAQRHVGAP